MSSSLSVDLREAFRQAALELPDAQLLVVERARDSSNRRRSERSLGLLAVVLAYRAGPRRVWGPVLLDLLAPAMLARLQRLRAEPPVMDEEDLRQQLVLEVLRAAAGMPLPENPIYLRSRLMARANQGMWRWLAREGRRQSRQQSFEALEEEGR